MERHPIICCLFAACIIPRQLCYSTSDCDVELPLVQNSFLNIFGNDVNYICGEDFGSEVWQYVKICDGGVYKDWVRFCSFNCKDALLNDTGYISQTRNGHDYLFWHNEPSQNLSKNMNLTFPQDFSDWQIKNPSENNFCRNPILSQSLPKCYVPKNDTSELCIVPTYPALKVASLLNPSHSLNLYIDLFIEKCFTFNSSIILLTSKQNWLLILEETQKQKLCSKVINVSLAVIDKESKYYFLCVDCSKLSDAKSTTEPVISTQTINNRITTQLCDDADCISTQLYTTTKISELFDTTEEGLGTKDTITKTTISQSKLQIKVTNNNIQSFKLDESTTAITSYTEITRNDHKDYTASLTTKNVPQTTIKLHNSTTIESNSSTFKVDIYCPCRCSFLDIHVKAQGFLMRNYKRDIQKQLKVDHFKLSQYVRMKMSAIDARPTSMRTGIVAILIITTIFLGIVLIDVYTVVSFCIERFKHRKQYVDEGTFTSALDLSKHD